MDVKFTWAPTLSVNNEKLDNQHKQLLEQINKLNETAAEGKGNAAAINETLNYLEYYFATHKKDEEQYMQEHGYPGLEAHRALHNLFVEHYIDLKTRILAFDSEERIIHDLVYDLAHYWVDHVGKEDKKYAEYIRLHPMAA